MAIKIIGAASGIEADVDTDRNNRVVVRAPAFGTLGCYSVNVTTGAIAATLAANGTLFSMRWTDATRLCLIGGVRASGIVSAAITAAVLFDLQVDIARAFTLSDSLGTAVVFTGDNTKRRTAMGTSLVGDMRVATTATLTAGTRTVAANPIGRLQGFTGTAVGTQIFTGGYNFIHARERDGEYPIVLAQNEGLLIRNPLAGPATGTITLNFTVEWMEVAAY